MVIVMLTLIESQGSRCWMEFYFDSVEYQVSPLNCGMQEIVTLRHLRNTILAFMPSAALGWMLQVGEYAKCHLPWCCICVSPCFLGLEGNALHLCLLGSPGFGTILIEVIPACVLMGLYITHMWSGPLNCHVTQVHTNNLILLLPLLPFLMFSRRQTFLTLSWVYRVFTL